MKESLCLRACVCQCLRLSLLSVTCSQESDNRHGSLLQRRGFAQACSGLEHFGYIPWCSRPPHTWAFVWVYVCAFAPVHVYTAVCTCHAHTTRTCMHTEHTHHTSRVCSCLFRSVCMHLLRLCQGQPLCATCAALHRLVTLGTVLELKVLACASVCHWANGGVQHLNVGLGSTIFLSG